LSHESGLQFNDLDVNALSVAVGGDCEEASLLADKRTAGRLTHVNATEETHTKIKAAESSDRNLFGAYHCKGAEKADIEKKQSTPEGREKP